MDTWTEKVAIFLLLLTAAFTIATMRGHVECWTPAHFAESHVKYTNALCATNATRKYLPFESYIPKESPENITEIDPLPLSYDENPLLRLLIGEILLILIMYHMMKSFIISTNLDAFAPKGSHKNYIKVPLYILFHIVVVIVWIILAVQSQNIMAENKPQVPFFLCNFKIRIIGNVQRYTVQCANSGFGSSETAATMNTGLCLIIALAKLVHVIYLFFIQPCGKVKNIATRLTEMGVIKTTNDVNLGFIFSDFFFAIMVHGDKFVHGNGQEAGYELDAMK